MSDLDSDLSAMTREQLLVEALKLRAAIREHRDSSGHDLCWHWPEMWALLPDTNNQHLKVPEWPQFMRGCVHYRSSLDRELGDAARTNQEFSG